MQNYSKNRFRSAEGLFRKKHVVLTLLLIFIVAAVVMLAGCGADEQKPTESVKPTSIGEQPNTEKEDDPVSDNNISLASLAELNGSEDQFRNRKETGEVYSHTVMIYLVGTDLESGDPDRQYRGGAASRDLKEILSANVDTEKNQILIMTGGTEKWQTEGIPSDKTAIFKVNGSALEKLQEYDENLNMADPSVLYTFLKFGFENYESDYYDLILWDHGGGPMFGFGRDEFHLEFMNILEIAAALEKSTSEQGKKLEILGFDACLMGNLEVANALSDYANYLIASPEIESNNGWNYKFLSALSKPDMDGARLSKIITDEFYSDTPYGDAATLTVLDLQKLPAFIQKLDAYFLTQQEKMNAENYSEIKNARYSTQDFGKSADDAACYDLIDLMDFILLSDSGDKAADLLQAYREVLLYMRSNLDLPTGGVSVYFPFYNNEIADLVLEYYPNYSFSEAYTEYIGEFYSIKQSNIGKGTPIFLKENDSLVSSEADGKRTVTLTLTDEQVKNFNNASMFIWHKGNNADYEEDGEIYEVMFRTDVVTLSGNTLKGSFENKTVFAANGDDVSDKPVYFTERNALTGQTQVLFGNVLLQYIRFDESDFKTGVAELQIAKERSENEYTVVNALLTSTNGEKLSVADRIQTDINDFDTITFTFRSRKAKYEDGVLLPLSQGDKTSRALGFEFKLNEDFRLFQKDIPEDELGEYVAQFEITDIYGNVIGSPLIPLG